MVVNDLGETWVGIYTIVLENVGSVRSDSSPNDSKCHVVNGYRSADALVVGLNGTLAEELVRLKEVVHLLQKQ